MDELLFVAYLLFFCWLVTKVSFFKKSELGNNLLIGLFLLKVIVAIIYGWQGVRFSYLIQMGDTWRWHFRSLSDMHILRQSPLHFFDDLSNNYEHGYGRFLSSRSSWWNDLHQQLFIKFLAVLNLFSRGNYYVNTIFYSFITLFGPVALFRVMKDAFPDRKWQVFAGVFLIPSFLYWTSGIHKDGLAFLGIALIIFSTYFIQKKKKLTIQNLWLPALGFLLLLLYRNYLLIVLPPALTAWWLSKKYPKPFLIYLTVYALFIIAFFTLPYLSPKLNLPEAVVEKQEDFLTLKGNSFVPVQKLEPTFRSFVSAAPNAFVNAVLRPFPSDAKHLFSLASAAENLLLLLLLFLFLFFRRPLSQAKPFFLFCLFLSFSIFFIIGYTVNFMGAIVRYRSICLPLLFTPILASLWYKGKIKTYVYK